MKEQIKRLAAFILAVSMICMLPGRAVFAESRTDDSLAEAAGADEMVELFSLSGAQFDDVNIGDWYEPCVNYVLNKGIMTGKGENSFAPAEELSRAQFATVMYRIAGSPYVNYSAVFPDVPEGTFFTRPVIWASQEEVAVIMGYEDGYFGPSDVITREQMAVMLYRYAEYREFDKIAPAGLENYPDASLVSDWAEEAIKWAVGAGIIIGDGGRLNPQGNTSRAVCAAMIKRFCEMFMPGEFKDIDMSASCQSVSITQLSVEDRTFWLKVQAVNASMDIQKVQARVWCYDVNSDACWYTLEKQPDGSYGAGGSVKAHGSHLGTYYAEFYVMLSNGVRLFLDWTDVLINTDIRVCIDPGHYAGADMIYFGDGTYYCEGEVTLQISLKLQQILREKYGITAYLTRNTGTISINGYSNQILDNQFIHLRGEMAKGADLFISVHTNSNKERANGYETYSQPLSLNKSIIIVNTVARYNETALKISNYAGYYLTETAKESGIMTVNEFQTNMNGASLLAWTDTYNDSLGMPGTVCVRTGGSGADYYGVLRGASNVGVPGLIIEHGYHSIPEVRAQITDGDLITKWAEADALGIAEGFAN